VAQLRQAPVWLWAVLALLGWAMPLFGWSLVVLVALEATGAVIPANAGIHRG